MKQILKLQNMGRGAKFLDLRVGELVYTSNPEMFGNLDIEDISNLESIKDCYKSEYPNLYTLLYQVGDLNLILDMSQNPVIWNKNIMSWMRNIDITNPIIPADNTSKAIAFITKQKLLGLPQTVLPLNDTDCIYFQDVISLDDSIKIPNFCNILNFSSKHLATDHLDLPYIKYIWKCCIGSGTILPLEVNAPILERIGKAAFIDGDVKYLNAPNLKYIGNLAFSNSNINRINIPDDCYIGSGAFSRCRNLEEVNIGNIQKLPESVFEKCRSLRNIEVPASCRSIGNKAFLECVNLESIKFNEGLNSVHGGGTFLGCRRLTEIVFPASLKNIKDYNFINCSGLKRLVIPKRFRGRNFGMPNGCTIEYF